MLNLSDSLTKECWSLLKVSCFVIVARQSLGLDHY